MFDPFAGTGTTLVVARQLNRRGLGVEIDPDNAACIRERLREPAPPMIFAAILSITNTQRICPKSGLETMWMSRKMYSIYHFFAYLYRNRRWLAGAKKLSDFAFDEELLSYKGAGRFPDLAIRVNSGGAPGDPTGGELVELKDSRSYTVSSFNSTIPSGEKAIGDITGGRSNVVREGMLARGDDIHALPLRDVYYLVRGHKGDNIKICLGTAVSSRRSRLTS